MSCFFVLLVMIVQQFLFDCLHVQYTKYCSLLITSFVVFYYNFSHKEYKGDDSTKQVESSVSGNSGLVIMGSQHSSIVLLLLLCCSIIVQPNSHNLSLLGTRCKSRTKFQTKFIIHERTFASHTRSLIKYRACQA